MLRPSALALTGLLFGVGCHLVGGLDGYIEGSLESGGADPTGTTGGAPGTGGAGATTSGGGAPTTSAGGMAPTCDDDSCMSQNECQVCSCQGGVVCDCDPVDTGELCTNGYCFNGECVDCIDNMNYPCGAAQETCSAFTCVSAECTDSVLNGLETDVDCGGPDCAKCGNGLMCDGPADCGSGYCPGATCQSCTLQEHCASTHYCGSGSCKGKKGLADACGADYECESNNCECIGPFCGCGF